MREIKFRANVSPSLKKVNLFFYKAELAYIILPLIDKKYDLTITIWDNGVDVSNSELYYYNDNIKIEITLSYKNTYKKIALQMIILGDKFCQNKIKYQKGFDNFVEIIKNTKLLA